MSHVIDVGVKIKDLDCLRKAIASIAKLEWREGKKTYNWWGRSVGDYPMPKGFTKAELGKCEHAIGLKGSPWLDRPDLEQPYEVGVVRSKTDPDAYTLLFDFYGGGRGTAEHTGQMCEKILRAYEVQVALKEAEPLLATGEWEVSQTERPDGWLDVKITKKELAGWT